MRLWLPLRAKYLDALICQDALPTDVPVACVLCHAKQNAGTYKCTDCFRERLLCAACMVRTHERLPLHHVQAWKDGHFSNTSLRSLGLAVQLGHNEGDSCVQSERPSKDFVVFDSDGYHHVDVRFCGCSHRSHQEQLLEVGWYPASTRRPSTAFTFRFLDTFHRLTLQGKITLHDYYTSVVQRTNSAGLIPPIYRYHEACLVTRQWAMLMMFKRAGRAHDPQGAEATPKGGLALRCPACPIPEVNLPENWDSMPEEQRWKYSSFIALDACFRLKLKDREIDDPELCSGLAYFVNEDEYQDHLRETADEPEEPSSSCDTNFNAITQLNTKNSGDKYAVSGVVAAKCGRHALILPNGVADLKKGERYVSTDWVFWSSLLAIGMTLVVLSYDIACKWSLHLKDRVKPFSSTFGNVVNATIRFFIPSLHIIAHGPKCRCTFSFSFNRWVGRTHGETIEQEWAHIGAVATSTREMGPGARHATLDDHWHFWNFRKIVAMGSSFRVALKKTLAERDLHRRILDEKAECQSPEKIAEWEAVVNAWEKDHSKENPFEDGDDTLTFSEVRLKLAQEESRTARDGALHETTGATLIRNLLVLEEKQRHLLADMKAATKSRTTGDVQAALQERRMALRRSLQQAYSVQDVYMPAAIEQREKVLHAAELEDKVLEPERMPIVLPSTLSEEERVNGCLRHVVAQEAALREAKADDYLLCLRRHRRAWVALLRRYKVNQGPRSGVYNTRNRSVLSSLQRKIDRAVEGYRISYHALKKLHPNGDWSRRLRPLLDSDITGPGIEPDSGVSHRHYVESWIWRVRPKHGIAGRELNEEEAADEHERREWARQYARFKRCEEEVVLLEEEMRRVLVTFNWKALWWESQIGRRTVEDSRLMRGLSAYARHQAAIQRGMIAACATQWKPVLTGANLGGDWINKWPTLPVCLASISLLLFIHSM
ncbi:hypothetical protein PUNSTDRAFT_76368 [Punctularia strigosozonata HHB-11173 SS5]|uniref:CxC2-like cysteine cluster KDZ transposase-associated domain-containing protein n=1 Tax=Punctularia strigosozonata (strain HHB-11173) TaxID=741275 RepID=R7S526_PUNST|nr:uncharacterized protein PUNSTDRAFT_76368 [Punctularia strigosozonata HHB-11173 SS5]EIN04406.1 hypothetical protein PUNSTDRAFT_76368 [Punctularia strigosozonata HHB-11173 SS5]